MINSLLELIGALFLAGLPIFVMLARIRRRRIRAAARGADSGVPPTDRREKTGGTPQKVSSREMSGGLDQQYSSSYRSLAETASSDRLLRRVDRYPPLQRAVVLKEILGTPKGIDAHLPGRNP
jgi:hypothetical protein